MRVLCIEDDTVVEVVDAVTIEDVKLFHSNQEVTEALDPQVRVGWLRVNGVFIPNTPVDSAEGPRITRLAFLNRFHDDEAIDIDLASIGETRSAATLRRFMSKLNSAQFIDLSDSSLMLGVSALEALALIGPGRAAEITSKVVSRNEIY